MTRPRILFIEPPAERRVGGIETALHGMANALGAAGLEIIRTVAPADDELRGADVVHFHGLWERSHPGLRRRCLAMGKPCVVSPHGMLEPWAFTHKRWKKLPYFHLIERPGLSKVSCILATSQAEATNLRRWFRPDQLRVIPLGLPERPGPDHETARNRLGWRHDEKVVLFLSRLHPKKGLHTLVDAWARIHAAERRTPRRLVIVGEGDDAYAAPLRQRTTALAGARVDWVGAQWGDAKWPWLQAADLLCLPTASENFGLVVPESLLVGTPVLTTPGTPWGELADGLPVTIVEPTVAELAAALRSMLAAPSPDAMARAETHRKVVGRFGWSRLANDYLEFYRSIMDSVG